MWYASASGSHYRTQGTFVPSAAGPPTHCWGNLQPTPSSPRRCGIFQVASASCIAISPRWWPAAMRTWPSLGFTSFLTGRGYSRITSKRWLFQAPNLFLHRSPLLVRLIRCVRVRSKRLTNSSSLGRETFYPRYDFARMGEAEFGAQLELN